MTLGKPEFVISGLLCFHCAIRFISIKWDQEDKRRTGRKGVNRINLTYETIKAKQTNTQIYMLAIVYQTPMAHSNLLTFPSGNM